MKENKSITVEIDGVDYTPVYNMNTFAKFGERHGLTIEDFSQMANPSLRQLLDLSWLAIQEYCRINKIDLPFDVFRLGELETEKIGLLIQSISANCMKLPKVERV